MGSVLAKDMLHCCWRHMQDTMFIARTPSPTYWEITYSPVFPGMLLCMWPWMTFSSSCVSGVFYLFSFVFLQELLMKLLQQAPRQGAAGTGSGWSTGPVPGLGKQGKSINTLEIQQDTERLYKQQQRAQQQRVSQFIHTHILIKISSVASNKVQVCICIETLFCVKGINTICSSWRVCMV